MENKERAEKIAAHCILSWPIQPKIDFITSQLDEAQREGYDKAFHELLDRGVIETWKTGFSAAREKAASIVEEMGEEAFLKHIAERMRKMEP